MPTQSIYLYWLIVACEASFWIALVAALAARYLLHRERLSRALLFSLPAIDVLLLAVTAADLKSGTPATFAHGLAAAYVGFTVAFGSVAVRWADAHFAHRFAGGPAPPGGSATRRQAVVSEFVLWLRSIAAWIIALVLLTLLIGYIDDEAVTRPLHAWFRYAFGSVVLWFVFGPLWEVLFFRKPKQ